MKITTNELALNDLVPLCDQRLSNVYASWLDKVPTLELKAAMEYALLNGGKKLRPLLVYATGYTFGASWDALDLPAAAVELIHTYSLVHDDLPCMDDADVRRGKPSCHKAYSEGTAVLTGDALQMLAIQLLANPTTPVMKADRRLQMIYVLSEAAGAFGMVAGQAMDITVMNEDTISSNMLTEIYNLKTGALFSACIELGRLASKDDDEVNQRALMAFGECIGLAFQIQDDLLDIEAESELLGKQQGIDHVNKKLTYPELHGINKAKEKVQSLYQEALEAINYLGLQAQLLRDLVTHMLSRKN